MGDRLENTAESPSTGEAHDYDDVVVDDTDGGVVLLPENKYRKSALITNVGEYPMRVTTDGSDPTPTHGKLVDTGSSLVLSSPYCTTKEIKAIREGSSNTSANASEVD